tara:strand:+ start:87 stop:653 length:567 start_codon:yes stop_codon:yes gene_type:complete
MHKSLPNSFVFVDQYENQIINNNTKIGVIYRNYKDKKRENELIKIAKACKRKRNMLFVSNNSKLAIKYGADGIYIPSFNKSKKFMNLEKKKLIILGSAHNQREIIDKIKQKCEGIFLSPIFKTNKSKKFLGVVKFNMLKRNAKIKIFALGGINKENIKKIKSLNVAGCGGISYFKKKPALKKAGFLKI